MMQVLGYGFEYFFCLGDRFRHLVLVLDHIKVKGSFVSGLELGIGIIHQFFPDLIL
jgi:hypothetical protein